MNVTDEIETLRTVVAALTPLDPDARKRVIDYACNMFGVQKSSGLLATIQEGCGADASRMKHQSSDKPKAAQQYLRDYSYKTMTKRVAVIAVYLERERGMKRFSLRDITEAFRDGKESKPPAYSQYNRSVVMGYLAKEGDQYYATSKAEALIDDYLKQQKDEEKERDAGA